MTERLHYDDPLLLELTTRVVAHADWKGAPSVVLERTVFYPESGGQMGDRGALGEFPVLDADVLDADVLDAQIDAAGAVHHLVEGPLPEVGSELVARVDGIRRREHMALHTGQHALSRALLDQLGAVTVSSRLGASACTLDVDVADLDLAALEPVQEAVNRLIDEDRPVRQRFVTDQEIDSLALRKPPPKTDRVRIVSIEGWDDTPCGGTHVTHTAQIQLLYLRRVERYKGGSRITFEAGPRARRVLLDEAGRLRDVAARLRCAPKEISKILERNDGKLDAAREEAGALRGRLADVWTSRLDAAGPVIAAVPGADPALLDAIATRLAIGSRLVALAAPDETGVHVLIARGPESQTACGALLKAIAKASGGRGGGRAERAQGKLPPGVDFEALVREAHG